MSRLKFWQKPNQKPSAPLGAPKGWPLFKDAIKSYRQNWKLILGLVAIVLLPASLLATYAVDPTADTSLSAYITFAEITMNVALIYAVTRLHAGKKASVRESYYQGSGMLVRLLLVSAILAVFLIPLLIGLLILGTGVASPGVILQPVEKVLLIILALLVSIPSIALITRSFFGLYVIFDTNLGPWQAVRRSRQLTRGRVWVTLGRSVVLGLLLLGLLVIPGVGLVALFNLTGSSIFLLLLQIVVGFTVLPLANLYLYRYYKALK